MKRVSIRDVAKMAGVSTATVSRVLNNKENVTDATREQALKVIRGLDYHPNLLGQKLRQSCTGTIIVLANTISKPFFIEFFNTLQKTAYANNYHLLLGQYRDDEEILMSYVNMLLSHLADGMLLVNHNRFFPRLERMCRDFPIIQCCERVPESEIPYVSEDWYECGYVGTMHLHNIGCRRIGFVTYSLDSLFSRKYEEGYREALRKNGLIPNPDWTVEIPNMEFEDSYQAIRRILSQTSRPDALYVVCDLYAPAAIRAAGELGLRIPQDLALVCGDNSFVADITTPTVTALDHRRQVMADEAFKLLLERIHDKPVLHSSISVAPELIVRESTTFPGKEDTFE